MSENTEIRAASPKNKTIKIIAVILVAVTVAVLWAGAGGLLTGMLLYPAQTVTAENVRTDLTADFENMLAKKMSGISNLDYGNVVFAPVKREYSLNDMDMVAPEPNPACYGTAETAAEMASVLSAAQELLDGQETLFTTETVIKEGSKIQYYLDDTILAITWKQVVGNGVYTFSEVKIAHASQFRRFLADGKYGATTEYTTQEMAGSVNAVVASSGDYYGYRYTGICVNQGQVYRDDGQRLDTCFVDENGDLLFVHRKQVTGKEAAQEYVDEHNVRFSLSFGPVMIENGSYLVPSDYYIGEINEAFARAALCQLDTLHYAVVAANYEHPYNAVHTMSEFAWNLLKLGITKAYALDGGQTAAVVMNDKLINNVSYGAQREISDIIYFATAIPEDEWE